MPAQGDDQDCTDQDKDETKAVDYTFFPGCYIFDIDIDSLKHLDAR
jgi:hypothetical protein